MHQDIKNTLIWMICATFILGIAIWQAQVAVTQDQQAKEVALPPPVKTRSAERPTIPTALVDPVSNYESREKKGLSDREIRWILDDFRIAGLDQGIRTATREEYLTQRQTQDRWYRDALVEGWSLDDGQAARVSLKLAGLHDLAKADFIEALNAGPRPFQSNGQWFNITGTEPIYQLVDAARRFAAIDSPYLPWSLCGVAAPETSAFENAKTDPAAQSRILLPPAQPLENGETVTTPDLLAKVRTFHPAQLKLLLLIAPGLSGDLEKQLAVSNL